MEREASKAGKKRSGEPRGLIAQAQAHARDNIIVSEADR
jgi:hypothetical protein